MICGIGINDVEEGTAVNGKDKSFYGCWRAMLKRCYSIKSLESKPTYAGCVVCEEWLSLKKFKTWFDKNYIQGYQLDKDIIKPGNKLYSPEFCCFVSSNLNKSLVDHKRTQGPYPTGVYKHGNRFVAQCWYRGQRKVVGRFDTLKMAVVAYLTFKSDYLLELSKEQTDPRVAKGLRLHARLKSDEARTMSRR